MDFSECLAISSIGSFAFASNSITALDLTDCAGLRLIGSNAFFNNPSLTGFELPEVTYDGTAYNTWVDGEANSYTAGVDMATNLLTFYVPFIPYTLTDNDVEMEEGVIKSCSYDFELKNIIIPQTLDGQTVISIGPGWNTFERKGITAVQLPATLQSIEMSAFNANEISSIDFSGCTGIATIGNHAFYGNNNLKNIDLSGCTVLSSIGESAFSNNSIEMLNLSDCSALISIAYSAFSNNSITALDLSNCTALATIGVSAFSNNSIASLNLTGCTGLRLIDAHAFSFNSSLTEFALPEVTYNGSIYNSWVDGELNSYTAGVDLATNLLTFYVPYIPYTLTDDDVEADYGVITSCSYDFELKNIIIPQILDGETVVAIADGQYSSAGLFYDKDILSIELPSSLEIIGEYAFYNNNIVELDLSVCTEISTISKNAFASNSISELDLADCTSLIEIGTEAFIYNYDLVGFNLPDPVIPGYFYSNWEDNEGGMYSGGDYLSNLRLSYTRVMPEITSIDPAYVSTAGSQEIVFKGKNFESEKHNKEVLFNGSESLSYSFWNDTMIVAVSPPNPEGPAKIVIPLENNLSYKSPKQILYTDDEVVSVCGDVSGVWEAGKTYLLTCKVTIPEGETLIIEEGVTVLAMPDEQIEFVCGEAILTVMGTEANPVRFSSATEVPGSWEGIKIYGTYEDCTFKHCIIENATTAVTLVGWAYLCDSESNYSEFENCIVRNNTKDGFYCLGEGGSNGCSWPYTGVCRPTIKNCQIYNNGGEGIRLHARNGYFSYGYNGAIIYNNLIYSNKNGIYCSGSDDVEPKITNNVIAGNTLAGINSTHDHFDSDDYNIANNIFIDNGTGIINEDTAAIILYNNGFWSNTVDLQGDLADSANIFLDPMFVDAGNQDYNLTAGSPCIDAGNNSFVASDYDYYNRARIWDGNNDQEPIIDMGIAEFSAGCYLINETLSICEGESVQVGDSIFSETGSYTVEMTDQFGCDSIVYLDLTVLSVNTEVTQSGDTLTAEASGAGYQWLNCDNNYTLISGAYSQSYVATSDGNYAVEVSFGGCKDTSNCYLIDIEEVAVPGINDFGSLLLVYPNPTKQRVSIELGTFYEDVRLRVFNTAGMQISDQKYGTVDIIQHDLKGDPGRYLFRVDTKEGKSATFKIVKY